MPFLEMRAVTKRFGPAEVLRGLDLAVDEHQVVCLIGPSGCGKSTILNAIAGFLAGRRIPDLTSGFRAARRECLLEFLHLLPNGFSTPTTTTLAFMKAGYSVRFEPIEAARRTGVSKMKPGSDGVRFFLILLKVMTIFSPLRIFLPVSLASFVLGAAYAAWTIATQSHVTNSSVLLILLSVVIFLMGLVSEQISSLRFEGRER